MIHRAASVWHDSTQTPAPPHLFMAFVFPDLSAIGTVLTLTRILGSWPGRPCVRPCPTLYQWTQLSSRKQLHVPDGIARPGLEWQSFLPIHDLALVVAHETEAGTTIYAGPLA